MPDLFRYTKMEMANQLRHLAERCDEPEKSTFNAMAERYAHEIDFVGTSRVAIAQSRVLIANIDRMLTAR